MATIAENLEEIRDTKSGLKNLITENGGTAPGLFSSYPDAIESIIGNINGLMIIMDTIKLNANTTLDQLNSLIQALPEAGTYTKSTQVITIGSGVNVRSSGSTDGTAIGKSGKTDVIPILGTASSGWYRINRYRYGTSSTAYDNPLKTYNNSSAYISNTVSANVVSNVQYSIKQIDISALAVSIQKSCNYKIAESKGWIIMFSTSSASDTVQTTDNTVTYSFNNCYTDNYSTSSYSSKIGTNNSTIRQGHYSGYYYYKGNIRFASARLKEVQSILTNSEVSKMEVFIQRANTNNGVNAAVPIKLYACDSTGANSDVAVTAGSLQRGGSTWITLSDTIVDGFKSKKYNHFKVYAGTSDSTYAVYETNPKLRITYRA